MASIVDTINLVKKLTFTKLINAIKLILSYYLSRILQKPIIWGYPLSVSIEPTTACNLKCPECPSGLRSFTRATGNLKIDFYRETIDQLYKNLVYLIFYFQGEPYINPKFLDMVNHAHLKGIYTTTSTNGHFLSPENCRKTITSKLDRLIISVDGTTQDTYQGYRKEGSLETVLQGARNMVKAKRDLKSQTPYIIFQFLVVSHNEHQVEDIKAIAKDIGIDEVKLKTAQVYDFKNGNSLIPENLKYSRYKQNSDGSYSIKHKLLNQCWKMWHACVITWDGRVVPCCFDKDAKYLLGHLTTEKFKKVWKDKKFQNFRSQILKGRDQIDICTNCTEGCNVWI